MPNPNKGEKQEAFISRCIGDAEAVKSFPDQKQREAFCYSQWERHSKSNASDDPSLASAKSVIGALAEAAMAILEKRPAQAADEVRPQTGTIKGMEIFGVGDWAGSRKLKVDGDMLDQIVDNFANLNQKVTGYGVALKLGHLTLPGDPAYGWMSDLRRTGDVLTADFEDVPAEIIDAIGKRRYNSASIELWPQINHAGKTLKNVLGGVALLGSEWPAVKGLKPVSASKFSDGGDGPLTLMKEQSMPNELKFSQADADALVLAAETRAKATLQTALDEANAKFAASETGRITAETALRLSREDSTKAQFAAVIDAAVSAGRVLPKEKAQLEAVATVFAAKTDKIKVGDKEMSGLDLFKAHVNGLPKKVTFGEQALSEDRDTSGAETAKDELTMLMDEKITASGGKLSAEAAMDMVLHQNPDLKNRYVQGV